MSKDIREVLSAAMDGESSSWELRRVLSEVEKDPELAEDWARFHTARAVIRKEQADFSEVDISAGVMAAITGSSSNNEEQNTNERSQENQKRYSPPSGLWRSVASAAMAASVASVVFLGWQNYSPNAGAASTAATSVAATGAASTPAQGRINLGGQEGGAELASQRLNQYMLKHSANAARYTPQGMMTFTRVVIQPAQKPLQKKQVELQQRKLDSKAK